MNPNLNKQLLDKLQKQGIVPGTQSNQNAVPGVPSNQGDDGVVMGEVPDMAPLDSVQNSYIQQHGNSIIDPTLMQNEGDEAREVEILPNPREVSAQPIQQSTPVRQPMQQPIQQPIQQPVQQTSVENPEMGKPSIAERIRAVEAELGKPIKTTEHVTSKAKSFLDEYGDETYYVINESSSHCALSDLGITVSRGECVDLLALADIKDIKKSRDLRSMLTGNNMSGRVSLRRLTPEEYLDAMEKQRMYKQQVEAVRAEMSPNQQNTANASQRIRPTILSKLEKLRLFSVPANQAQGMQPIEFMQWALTENMTIAELDYVISHPNVIPYPDIITALYKKRQTM